MRFINEIVESVSSTYMLKDSDFSNVINELYKKNGYSNIPQNNEIENKNVDLLEIEELEKEPEWTDVSEVEIKKYSYMYDNAFFKIESGHLIIAYPPTFISNGQNIEETITIMQKFQGLEYKKAYHLLPEVTPSSIEFTGLGRNHVCLRLLEYDREILKNNVLIDPRSIAQQFYDGVNCGRYVLMMLAAALRYIENGVFVEDLFEKNPLIMNAAIFKTIPELQQAVNCLYEYPAVANDTINIEEQLKFIYKFRCDQGKDYNVLSYFIPNFMFYGFSASDKLDALNRKDAMSSKVLSQGSCSYFLDINSKDDKADQQVNSVVNKIQ